MKALLILLTMAATGCFANETNNIWSKPHNDGFFFGLAAKVVSEPPHVTSDIQEFKDKDGKCFTSVEQVYRGKDEIMSVVRSLNSQGDLVVKSRNYFFHGDIVMTEMAVRMDDKLDTILLRHPGSEDLEVFRRQDDGSVRPANPELVQAFINQESAIAKIGSDNFNDVKNREKLEELWGKIITAMKVSDEAK
jgi:hypothetical protein